MRRNLARSSVVVLLAALSLAACASRNEPPAYASVPPAEDDDAFCQQGGKVKVGSPDYVYCRKDRDAARNAAVSRGDRAQPHPGIAVTRPGGQIRRFRHGWQPTLTSAVLSTEVDTLSAKPPDGSRTVG